METHVYRMCKKETENEMKFVGYLLRFTKCVHVYPKNKLDKRNAHCYNMVIKLQCLALLLQIKILEKGVKLVS